MQLRRSTSLVAALVVGTLALSACGSSSTTGATTDNGKKTLKIGFQGPLSGNNSQLGINGVDGVKTAIDEANKKGDLTFNLALASSDDIGLAEQGAIAAQRLIDDKSVVAVVGPMFSGATRAAGKPLSDAGLLAVSPSATDPSLTASGFTTFFRVVPPDNVQGEEVARYLANTVKAKTVFSLDDKSQYGTGLSGVVAEQLKKKQVTVIQDGIPPTKDYTAVADKIVASKADAIYYSGYYAEFGLLVRALKSKGYTGTIMSGDGSNDDKFISTAGAANAEGVLLSCPCGDANVDPNAKAFLASYKSVNSGAKPGTYSAEAYDATNAIISVLKSLGKDATDRAKVAEAFKTVDFTGLTKQIKFSPIGEVTAKTVFIYKVVGGSRSVLGTTANLVK